LVDELSRRWCKGLGILATSLALSLCALAAPRVTQAILDQVLPSSDFHLLWNWLLLLLGVTVLQVGLTVWRRLTLVRMSLGIDHAALTRLCDHLLQLPTGFFRKHRAGELSSRFQDHQHIRHLFVSSLCGVMIDAVMVVVYVVVLFCYNVQL